MADSPQIIPHAKTSFLEKPRPTISWKDTFPFIGKVVRCLTKQNFLIQRIALKEIGEALD
jgi:hypothetical protein